MVKESSIVRLAQKWESEKWQESWVPAVKAGDTIYVSGIVAIDRLGVPVGKDNLEAQTERCFDALTDILQRFASSLSDVVKLVTYFSQSLDETAVNAYFAVRKRYFGDAAPASTGVLVKGLAAPEFLLEIEAIAYVGGRHPPSER
jgi:2-iminobutanoate/2-iminopropanoate deaminase